jgi:hypothetical protein
MSALPKFADARCMERLLSTDGKHTRLASVIRKASLAQSCAGDLAQALTCCEALQALLASPRKNGTLERGAVESSLLMNGILLYARATSTNSGKGERGSIHITAHLTPDQLSDHNILIKIRNRALAHVYSQGELDGVDWHTEKFFFVETDSGWKPAGVSKRVQFTSRRLNASRGKFRSQGKSSLAAFRNM